MAMIRHPIGVYFTPTKRIMFCINKGKALCESNLTTLVCEIILLEHRYYYDYLIVPETGKVSPSQLGIVVYYVLLLGPRV